ncbi:MAG: MerR family transcriptional regulator [Actinobacteria bacterium]|nr:MerR family transcriptional regulator [Actinomycetota bacterium]
MSEARTLRVEDLAAEAGTSVDTIRYYQRLRLLAPPRRVGRHSEYGDTHAARLAEIRRLADDGFTLAQIRDLGDKPTDDLGRLADGARARSLSRSEVAEQAGVPEGLVVLLVDNGLLQPLEGDDPEQRFDDGAVAMVQAGLAISNAGIPLDELVHLAADHATNVDEVVRRAVELFEAHVKADADPDQDLAEVVRTLLPAVVRLVAQHFHRTLVARARERMGDGDRHALADALVAADDLEVRCEWP